MRGHTGDRKMGRQIERPQRPPKPTCEGQKAVGRRNPDFKETNIQTKSPELSVTHLSSIPGLQDTAHARAEDPVQRKVSALRRGQGEAS